MVLEQAFSQQALSTNLYQINPKKSEIFTKAVLYLGFEVSGEGVEMDPAKIEAVSKCPTLTTVEKVRSFSRFTKYHRRFIWDFAIIEKPNVELIKKS